jgi:Sulfotransferase family
MNRPLASSDAVRAAGPLADRRMLYVIGAQRAGTTWLHSLFNRHPDMCTPGVKEVHYWDTVRPPHHYYYREKVRREREEFSRAGWPEIYRQSGIRGILKMPLTARYIRAKYDALHDEGADHACYGAFMLLRSRKDQLIVDNTPAYSLLDAATYAEMAGICGSAKFVLVMRDPVSRLWSGLALQARNSTPEDLDRDLALQVDEALGEDRYMQRARSDYPRMIGALEKAVPAEDIHYIFFEELFSTPTVVALYDFLGVARKEPTPEKRVNASRRGRKIDPETRARCREHLAPVYDYVAARFGDKVPDAWNR